MNNVPADAMPQDCGMNHEANINDCPYCFVPLVLETVRPIAGRIEYIKYLKCPQCGYKEPV